MTVPNSVQAAAHNAIKIDVGQNAHIQVHLVRVASPDWRGLVKATTRMPLAKRSRVGGADRGIICKFNFKKVYL